MTWYNDDTRESYIERKKEDQLWIAKKHHELGNNLSMWLSLFNWAMCEDFYGENWDQYWIKHDRPIRSQP